ncbi:hypothetical protein MLD38_034195 [Melastoma candidum]|uniref:Uncharacterized protein n=1 Tax=Melastoma candidum TaxID=119954 RepID=A0ACB9MDG3_9MYRT|nr:hypothetical protein MLD38_034195 [Melastoma candidum]
MGQKDNYVAVDLGGSVITGIHANPLGVLARQLSVPLHKVRDKCPLYRPDGTLVDEQVDAKVEFIFNRLLDRVMELRKIKGTLSHDISLGAVLERLRQLYAVARNDDEKQLLDWHLANLEYANAGCLSNLSAAYWDQDDPFEMGGDHCFLAGGNGRLIKALSDGVPIFFNKTVNAVRYGNEGVEVTTGNQIFRAEAVLCTMPLGVLKKKAVLFEPELPPRKVAAIERLGFGLLNKVAMVFPYVFWGEDLDTFGCLREDSKKRGEFFLFYSYHTVSGAAALIALVAGEAAEAFEMENPYSIVHRLMTILRGIYKPKGIDVPDPLQTICTRWGSDPLSHGSYSHIRVNSSGKDYEILAENVGNRLFFAGEATTRQYPATMHGAFLSGLREASRIFRASGSWQNNMVKAPPKHIRNSSDLLFHLFKNPDLAFGNFSVILERPDDGQKTMGILRAIFQDKSSNLPENSRQDFTKPPLQLYTVLSDEQAHRLQLLTEGDDIRLLYLNKTLRLKLMGVAALVNSASSLIASIASSKKGRCRGRPSSRHQNFECNS